MISITDDDKGYNATSNESLKAKNVALYAYTKSPLLNYDNDTSMSYDNDTSMSYDNDTATSIPVTKVPPIASDDADYGGMYNVTKDPSYTYPYNSRDDDDYTYTHAPYTSRPSSSTYFDDDDRDSSDLSFGTIFILIAIIVPVFFFVWCFFRFCKNVYESNEDMFNDSGNDLEANHDGTTTTATTYTTRPQHRREDILFETELSWTCSICAFENSSSTKCCKLCEAKCSTSQRSSVTVLECNSSPKPTTLRQVAASRRHQWKRTLVQGTEAQHQWTQDRSSRNSLGFVRLLTSDNETDWQETSVATTDFDYITLMNNDDDNNTQDDAQADYKIINLEGIAGLSFVEKSVFFTKELHRLWVPWDDVSGYYRLKLSRDNLLQDACDAILPLSSLEMRRRWKVEFLNEAGLDAGGVSRELITQLCLEIFRTDVFTTSGSGTGYYLSPSSSTDIDLQLVALAGRIIGKALLEEYLIPCYLAVPLLKHILSVPISLSDMQFLDPMMYQSINWIRNNTVTEDLAIDFSVQEGKTVVELKPNGASILVTEENKMEYLELLLKYKMVTSVSKQLSIFLTNLYCVIPEGLLKLFDYQELELVLNGVPTINIKDWKRYTTVKCHAEVSVAIAELEEKNIEWFWDVITNDFTEQQRARLLQFVTGSSKVPPHGFKTLLSHDGVVRRFSIVLLGDARDPEVGYFPKAHTCFNRLDIPLYHSLDDMKKHLTMVVEMDITGFTIE